MKVISLSAEETRQHGYTHKVVVELTDLKAQRAPATALVLTPLALEIGKVVRAAAFRLDAPLADSKDTVFNTCAVSLGDNNSAARYLSDTETNLNGVYIKYKAGNVTPTAYTTNSHLQITVKSQTGKALSSLTQGQLSFYIAIGDLTVL